MPINRIRLYIPAWPPCHKFRSKFKKGRRFRRSHDKLLMILWTGNRDGYRELASQKGRVVQHDTAKTFEYLFALCSNWKKWPRFSSGHGPSESMVDRTRPPLFLPSCAFPRPLPLRVSFPTYECIAIHRLIIKVILGNEHRV